MPDFDLYGREIRHAAHLRRPQKGSPLKGSWKKVVLSPCGPAVTSIYTPAGLRVEVHAVVEWRGNGALAPVEILRCLRAEDRIRWGRGWPDPDAFECRLGEEEVVKRELAADSRESMMGLVGWK
ncbi:hypothetical protein [Arthrobacter sp. M4]|uniref:hypothetical protein n=1 Tax=Arthrobacter sp. M4 TaxID=218160 RepID=UPI001CDC0F4B|nr:hypothetical protein [Arthrobacter sp. M4]MCA4135703.1 hypothetical protein [Arthrobacter sp. M4]